MADHVLAIETRTATGKGVARKLRAKGTIPGVYYGDGSEPRPVQLNARELIRLLEKSSAGINTLIDLKGGGDLDGKVVLVKALQRDPVNGSALHADLYAVNVARQVTVSVPIHLTGTAPGLKMGGIVDHALREVEIACLPRAIPEQLLIDVSMLELGHSLHVRDIPLPAGVELRSDRDLPVVSVVTPRVEEEAVAPTEGLVPVEGEEPAAAEGAGEEAADES